MAVFDKKEAFLKQIGIFLQKREYEKAYELSKEFTARYDNAISHLILSKCLFWMGSYKEMLPEARKALRMSTGDDKEPAAVLLAAACYKLGRLAEGQKALSGLGETKNMDAIKMRFMIAAMQGKKKEQEELLRNLAAIDQKEAESFAMSIILQKDFETIDAVRAVPKKISPSKRK